MDKIDFLTKYLDIVEQRMWFCSKQVHRMVKYFAIYALLFYLVYAFDIQELNLFGVTAQIPQSLILGVAPLILIYYFHNIICFDGLDFLYLKEFKRVLSELGLDLEVPITKQQMELLAIPSQYSLISQDIT